MVVISEVKRWRKFSCELDHLKKWTLWSNACSHRVWRIRTLKNQWQRRCCLRSGSGTSPCLSCFFFQVCPCMYHVLWNQGQWWTKPGTGQKRTASWAPMTSTELSMLRWKLTKFGGTPTKTSNVLRWVHRRSSRNQHACMVFFGWSIMHAE